LLNEKETTTHGFFLSHAVHRTFSNQLTHKESKNYLFLGHSIHVFKTGTGYGYDISYQNRLWMHQSENPFTSDRNGLAKEEDAIKLAKWQVAHFRGFAMQPTVTINKTIPKNLAGQLKITTN
jgi:hypothetical protein